MRTATIPFLAQLFAASALVASSSSGAPRLALFLTFQHTPSAAVVGQMEAEVERLLGAAPENVQWEALQNNNGQGTTAHLALVRFKGTCDAAVRSEENVLSQRMTLASTVTVNGRVLPIMNIECDQLRAFLKTRHAEALPWSYGRALGQVLAHELYHVLLGTLDHSREGISKGVHSPDELGRVTNRFEPAVKARILEALR